MAFDILIPPAILLDNPGVNRDEFVELLAATQSDIHFGLFHSGLHGLADLLGLVKTDFFKDYERYSYHVNPDYRCIEFAPKISGLGEGNERSKFAVLRRQHRLMSPRISEEYFPSIPSPGRFANDVYGNVVLIRELLHLEGRFSVDEDFGYMDETYFAVVFGSDVTADKEVDTYDSLAELVRDYPQYSPDVMFDWSPPSGLLYPTCERSPYKQFFWERRGDRYYLDEESIARCPAIREKVDGVTGYNDHCAWSYTDLIVTAEAIRHQEWDSISYLHDGVSMRSWIALKEKAPLYTDFLGRHPQSQARYHRAVWDSHTATVARDRGLSNSEWLRLRLLAGKVNSEDINSR